MTDDSAIEPITLDPARQGVRGIVVGRWGIVETSHYGLSTLWWVPVAMELSWRQLGWRAVAVLVIALLCPPFIRRVKIYYLMFAGRRRHAI